jgi:hypothetical protein
MVDASCFLELSKTSMSKPSIIETEMAQLVILHLREDAGAGAPTGGHGSRKLRLAVIPRVEDWPRSSHCWCCEPTRTPFVHPGPVSCQGNGWPAQLAVIKPACGPPVTRKSDKK